MTDDLPGGGAPEAHPAPLPHPFAASATPGDFGYAGPNPVGPQNWTAAAPQGPPPPPRRRGWLFHAAWIAGTVVVVGLLVQGAIVVAGLVTTAIADSGYQSDQSGTVLSDAWSVDGVDIVYVEARGSECESEFCWEWLLITQPDCATATVTVEISDSLYGDPQRAVELSVTVDQVTSVLVEAEPDDGEFADLTSIDCGLGSRDGASIA